MTLYASGSTMRRTWVDKIKEQQEILAEKRRIFAVQPLLQRQFGITNKVNSTVILSKYRMDKCLPERNY